MPKIDGEHKNYLAPEICEETHLREIFYSSLIFQQNSMICIGRHVGEYTLCAKTSVHVSSGAVPAWYSLENSCFKIASDRARWSNYVGGEQGGGSPGEQGAGGAREMGEERNEPNNVSWLPFNVLRGLKQILYARKVKKPKFLLEIKKNKKGRREAAGGCDYHAPPAPNWGKAYP